MQLLKYTTSDTITAFSTKRCGGASNDNYSGFNITHYCGDDAENVATNQAHLCAHLKIDDRALILPHQTHGTAMLCIDKKFLALDSGERWHIDLPRANHLQLLSCGLLEANIIHSGICTHTSHREFFSARRLGIKSGRIFNGIMINEK